MFDDCYKSSYSFRIYLLIIFINGLEKNFALSNLYRTHNTGDESIDENISSSIAYDNRIQMRTSFDKDKLNAAHLRETRESMLKSIALISVGVVSLILIGGIVGIIVYYVKK